MTIAVAILNRLFIVARKSYLYALLYLVYTIRLFGNNLGYSSLREKGSVLPLLPAACSANVEEPFNT